MGMEIKTTIKRVVFTGLTWLALVGSASAQSTSVEYIHTDALGSPVATTDAAGNVVEEEFYEPYGAPIAHGATDGPGFTGHVQDSATELTYMEQRYYEPSLGRFLSGDPVSADAETGWNYNRYNYAANNPYRFKDPDGRIIDTVADVGFIIYDVYTIASEGATPTNMAALGADAAGALIPGATGLGPRR